MLHSQADQDRLTAALRELLAEGRSLGDSLRELHEGRGIGLLWLVPAVESACGLSKSEAQRAVVRETVIFRLP